MRISVPGVEVGLAEDVDRFVDAVGEQDLLRLETKVRRDAGFDGLALGIASEIAAGDAAEGFEHARRAGEGVLVEVEAEAAAVAERRVVLLDATDDRGGLRTLDFDVSHAWPFPARRARIDAA